MKFFLIINPRSGNQKIRKIFPQILEELTKKEIRFDHVFASSYTAIRTESEYANSQGYDVVVAVGGDGTINACINGFYNENGNRISAALFGVIYTGTSPDFCKSYGIPLDLKKAIGTLADLRSRSIRTGRIRFHKLENPMTTETRVFACCANIGLGAGVAEVSNKIRKYTGDFAGTLLAVLWNIMAVGPRRLIVSIDGQTKEIPRVMNISVGRTKFIASGIRVSDGMPDDVDLFYLLTAKNITLRVLPRMLYQVYAGKFTTPGILGFQYARNLEFQSPDKPAGVEFDGDPAGILPCSISMAPDALDLIVEI